jgi:hypothetical protein
MEKFFKHPRLIVAVIGAITIFFALQLPRAQLDNNNFRFVPVNDPSRVAVARISEVFGSQVNILVGLERRYGTILDADFLQKLRQLVDKMREVDMVESVSSVITTDYIEGVGDSVVVSPIVGDDFSGTAGEIAELKDKLLGWDAYRRSLVSDNLTATQIIVSLSIHADEAGSPRSIAAYYRLRELAYSAGFSGTTVYVAGLPVLSAAVNEACNRDLIFLVPLVVIIIVAVLFISFRRPGGVLLPLLTVLISAVWSIGAMPLFGVRLSIVSTVLPVILVAVGSAYGIHVVSHYYDDVAKRSPLDREGNKRLIFAVIRKVRWPVFLAALTTFAGFFSLCFTSVLPIREFGIFASFGVLAAFAVSLTLIPALIIIRGPVAPKKKDAGEAATEDRLSAAIADSFCAAAAKKRSTIGIFAILGLVSLIGLSRVITDNVLVEYFKDYTDVVKADRFIREKFGGTKSISIVVSSDTPGDVLRPEVLSAMDGLSTYASEKIPEVGKVLSFTDFVKRINQVLNADEQATALASAERRNDASGGSSDLPLFGFGPHDGEGGDDPGEPAFGFGDYVAPPRGVAGAGAAGAGTSKSVSKASSGTTTIVGTKVVTSSAVFDEKAAAVLVAKALSECGRYGYSADQIVDGLFRAANYKGRAYYEIPTDPARYRKTNSDELKNLIANYMVLLAGSIDAFADDPLEPKALCMSVQLRTIGQIDTDRAIDEMRAYIAERFPKDVKVEIAGTALIEKSLNVLVVQSQLMSVALSILFVFLILSIYYRSAVAGLIGLAPLVSAILIDFAVMGFAGIKLNIGTAMVASIAVGVGIDYTIHYMAAYHREYLASGGGNGAFLRSTFYGSGKAIIFNATSVGLGFAVLGLSQFNILASLGLLIALTMATSSLASLTLLPVLLNWIKPAFMRRPLPWKWNAETPEDTV